ncbi:uncharacterized protein TrAtP1_006806 [Trichoderma atroviride]|uniref:uncharacterized protein n=1 Tax=Hypocrea atroviridis TaxID=63577 RepID=UPI0033226D80|nr:hypothetical protein TrAtP1_006806 [Trichoderma atroviride]
MSNRRLRYASVLLESVVTAGGGSEMYTGGLLPSSKSLSSVDPSLATTSPSADSFLTKYGGGASPSSLSPSGESAPPDGLRLEFRIVPSRLIQTKTPSRLTHRPRPNSMVVSRSRALRRRMQKKNTTTENTAKRARMGMIIYVNGRVGLFGEC